MSQVRYFNYFSVNSQLPCATNDFHCSFDNRISICYVNPFQLVFRDATNKDIFKYLIWSAEFACEFVKKGLIGQFFASMTILYPIEITISNMALPSLPKVLSSLVKRKFNSSNQGSKKNWIERTKVASYVVNSDGYRHPITLSTMVLYHLKCAWNIPLFAHKPYSIVMQS